MKKYNHLDINNESYKFSFNIRKIFIAPIILYKKIISPLLPNSCKYYPTCSQYAIEAIEKYGVIKGILLGIWRILRCNPFSKGGIDKP